MSKGRIESPMRMFNDGLKTEEEEFERFNRVEMDSFQTEMDSRLEMSRSKAVGSIPLDRPDGV